MPRLPQPPSPSRAVPARACAFLTAAHLPVRGDKRANTALLLKALHRQCPAGPTGPQLTAPCPQGQAGEPVAPGLCQPVLGTTGCLPALGTPQQQCSSLLGSQPCWGHNAVLPRSPCRDAQPMTVLPAVLHDIGLAASWGYPHPWDSSRGHLHGGNWLCSGKKPPALTLNASLHPKHSSFDHEQQQQKL